MKLEEVFKQYFNETMNLREENYKLRRILMQIEDYARDNSNRDIMRIIRGENNED